MLLSTPAVQEALPRGGERAQWRRELALLRHALANSPASLFVTLVASLGLSYDLGSSQLSWVWAWCGAMLGLLLLRLTGHLSMQSLLRRREPSAGHVAWLFRAQATGLLAAGVLWALMGWFGLDGQSIEGQFKIIIILSAMAGGATGVLAPLRWSGPLYIALLLVPACIKLAWLPNPQPAFALLGLVFCAVMVAGHRNNHRLILRSLKLQEDNLGLIEGLKTKNTEVQAMNALLENRVAQRTEDLRAMAHRDALTGLLNRRGIVQGLERLLSRVSRNQAPDALAVLFLDLDRFKQINDGIGHDVGDLVLVEIAARFKRCVPAQAVFGRWGGDEFIVILGAVADVRGAAMSTAKAMTLCLDAPIDVHGERLNLGVSIGVAFYPSQTGSPAELIRAADLAAAEAKRQGRDRVVEFHHDMSATQRRRLEISLALRSATRDGSLRLVYQAIVDARTGRHIALEALLRWRSATVGEVRPDEFIPVAEESDRIVEIGAWVLRQACCDAVGWNAANGLDSVGLPPKVAVNVSVRQLLRPEFADVVADALASSGLQAERLILEVTESVFAEQNLAQAKDALTRLHAMGVQIDVDDFGTGYSSLSRLREFPLDAVKIDRSFVCVLDAPSRAIIEGTVLMARRFGLMVIAEGIETREQATQLLAMGIDAFQGYLFGRPNEVVDLRALQPFWVQRAMAEPAVQPQWQGDDVRAALPRKRARRGLDVDTGFDASLSQY